MKDILNKISEKRWMKFTGNTLPVNSYRYEIPDLINYPKLMK